MTLSLFVKRDTVDARTGLREWDLQVVERDDQNNVVARGPLRTRGVDADSVRMLYGQLDETSYQRYLVEKVKPEMVAFYEQWKAANGNSMAGQEL